VARSQFIGGTHTRLKWFKKSWINVCISNYFYFSIYKYIYSNLLDIPNCETEGYFYFPNYQTNHFMNLHRGNLSLPWESPIGNPKNKCFLCWILVRYFHIAMTNWPKQYIEQSFSMDILYGSKAWSPLIYTNKNCL